MFSRREWHEQFDSPFKGLIIAVIVISLALGIVAGVFVYRACLRRRLHPEKAATGNDISAADAPAMTRETAPIQSLPAKLGQDPPFDDSGRLPDSPPMFANDAFMTVLPPPTPSDVPTPPAPAPPLLSPFSIRKSQ